MIGAATNGIRRWIVGLFVSAIERTSRPEDRHAAIQWLLKSRDILAGDAGLAEKLKALNAQLNARAAASAIAATVADAVRNYRTSLLPWPMKVAMPATLAAIPVVGLHGAGIAAFGSAIGLPVLLLVFLGTAGITSIIEAVATIPNSRAGVAAILALVLAADYMRNVGNALREAMRDGAASPRASPMPEDEAAIRAALLAMDPFDFESHVMSYFEKAGLYAVVTPHSNDFGMDGFAAHPDGLIVVQCKRYATDNKVGRPALQQFASVIRDQAAWRGYLVTTSSFSSEATAYAPATGIVLVDIAEIVRWTKEGLSFEASSEKLDAGCWTSRRP